MKGAVPHLNWICFSCQGDSEAPSSSIPNNSALQSHIPPLAEANFSLGFNLSESHDTSQLPSQLIPDTESTRISALNEPSDFNNHNPSATTLTETTGQVSDTPRQLLVAESTSSSHLPPFHQIAEPEEESLADDLVDEDDTIEKRRWEIVENGSTRGKNKLFDSNGYSFTFKRINGMCMSKNFFYFCYLISSS